MHSATKFKFYGEEEGLKNLAVQAVLHDRAGFLWVGTQDGLYRYDGNHFTAFTTREGLPGTRIEALHESEDGTLRVSTDRGLARRRERARTRQQVPLHFAFPIGARCLAAGMDQFINKPIDAERFVEVVEAAAIDGGTGRGGRPGTSASPASGEFRRLQL